MREWSEPGEDEGLVGVDGGQIGEGNLVSNVVGRFHFHDDLVDFREVGDEFPISSQLHRPRGLTTDFRHTQLIGSILNDHVVDEGKLGNARKGTILM